MGCVSTKPTATKVIIKANAKLSLTVSKKIKMHHKIRQYKRKALATIFEVTESLEASYTFNLSEIPTAI